MSSLGRFYFLYAELLAGRPCETCGLSKHPLLMEFEPTYPLPFSIAQAITRGYRMEKLIQMVARCRVRCIDCIRLHPLYDGSYADAIREYEASKPKPLTAVQKKMYLNYKERTMGPILDDTPA